MKGQKGRKVGDYNWRRASSEASVKGVPGSKWHQR